MSSSDSVDISGMPDVIRLVEEAAQSDRPLVLRRGEKIVATMQPTTPDSDTEELTESQIQALRSAAGAWTDFDSEAFLERVYSERDTSDRPPVTL